MGVEADKEALEEEGCEEMTMLFDCEGYGSSMGGLVWEFRDRVADILRKYVGVDL